MSSSRPALWIDGNAVAGMLEQAFGAEMTLAPRRCPSCHTLSVLGAHRAYLGAGIVLRCPACGDIGMRIATLPDRHVISLAGQLTLELPRR